MTQEISMIYVLAAFIVFMFIFQVMSVVKLLTVARQMNSLLFEMRIVFKKSGLYFNHHTNQMVKLQNCQFCKNRVSFIQITDSAQGDQFYYRCRIHNMSIDLNYSCEHFERDRSIA